MRSNQQQGRTLQFLVSNFWFLIFGQQCFRLASGGGDVGRLQQTRYDDDAPCASRHHLRKVVQLDPADAEDRSPNDFMDATDVIEANRLVVRFGRRGKERAKADVIRALLDRCDRLSEGVGGFADRAIALNDCPRAAIVRSSWPRCTPSMARSRAISAWSLMIIGTPALLVRR